MDINPLIELEMVAKEEEGSVFFYIAGYLMK